MRELMKVNLTMLKRMKWLWIVLPVFNVFFLLTLIYSAVVKEYSSFSFLYDLLGGYPDYAMFSGCFVCLWGLYSRAKDFSPIMTPPAKT